MKTTLFCMPSSPCSATGWLSRVLNSHPQVFCSHDLGTRGRFTIEAVGRFADDAALRDDPTLAFAIALLLQTGYRAVGDVNGVPGDDWRRAAPRIPEAWAAFRSAFELDAPQEIAVRTIELVRHPVLQVDSYSRIELQNWRAGRRGDAVGEVVLREFAERRRYGWHMEQAEHAERWAFLTACKLLAERAFSALANGDPVFRCEDLTSAPQQVQRLLQTVDPTLAPLPEEQLQQVMAQVDNRHRPQHAPRTPAATFAGWAEWQRAVFCDCFGGFARRTFTALGYELPTGPDGSASEAAVHARPGHALPTLPRSQPDALLREIAAKHREVLVFGGGKDGAHWLYAARAAGLAPLLVVPDEGTQLPEVACVPLHAVARRFTSTPLVLTGPWRTLADRLADAGWHDGPVTVADPAARS